LLEYWPQLFRLLVYNAELMSIFVAQITQHCELEFMLLLGGK
jgi:hypothetical protein